MRLAGDWKSAGAWSTSQYCLQSPLCTPVRMGLEPGRGGKKNDDQWRLRWRRESINPE